MKRFTTLAFWLPKIPLLSLFGIFLLPIVLMEIHYETGLFFIALYISYWTVKVFESYYYVLRSYLRLMDYEKKCFHDDTLVSEKSRHLKHIVIIPIYTEPYDVIEEAVVSVMNNDYPHKKNITILLATEARAPDAEGHAARIIENFRDQEISIVNIVHPADIPGE